MWLIRPRVASSTLGRYVFLFLILTYFYSATVHAQFYSAGVDPSGIHWKQVKQNNIRVIFPEGYDKQATALLARFEELKKEAVQTLPAKIPSISIVLHNQTAQANGFVTWAPKRMELFTLPDQAIYPQDWLNQLAVHEFRHVVQISNLRQGLTKVLSILTGEQAIGAVLGLYVPTWFLEGDAVSFETAFSPTGRGRIPSFYTPYLSMLDQHGSFCYEKAVLGSYKHFIPDRYVVGYHLVSYSRFYYGERIWKTTLDLVARRPYSIMPFSNGIKKWSGMNKFQWYRWSAKQIDSLYTEPLVCVNRLSHSFSAQALAKDFVSYRYPHYVNDSLVLAEKSGLSYVKEWVLINREGKEKHVLYPGYYNITNTTYSDGALYYTEYRFDKRWTHRLWSEVTRVEVKRRKKKKITYKAYAAAPAVRGEQVVYLKQEIDNSFSLVIKGKEKEEQIHASPRTQMLFTPAWESDSTIVCIALDKEKGKYFTRLDLKTGQWIALSTPTFYDIQQLQVWQQYLIHRGAYENREQLYAYDTLQKQLYRITREPYESTDPSVTDNRLLFSSYTANGYVVKEMDLDTLQFIPITLKGNQWDNTVTRTMAYQEQYKKSTGIDSLDTSKQAYVISNYRKATHLINVHSWAPAYVNVDNATVQSGATVFSQNLLSTSFLTLGYLFDNTEQTGKWIANYKYTGFFPVLSVNTSLGDRYMPRYGSWKEWVVNAGVSLPFTLTHGPYSEKLTFSVLPQWQSWFNTQEKNAGGLKDQDILSVSYRMDYQRAFRMAPRDLMPAKGQSIFFQYRHAPVSIASYSSFVAGSLSTWLPSLWKHHAILARVQGHHYERGGLYLSSPIAFPRGYSYLFSQKLLRGSVDYAFPLFYPDWRLTALFYIKRIKANVFYDAAVAFQDSPAGTFYESKGVDIRVDFHFANFLAPIDLGVRFYQLNRENRLNYQLLFTYQLNN